MKMHHGFVFHGKIDGKMSKKRQRVPQKQKPRNPVAKHMHKQQGDGFHRIKKYDHKLRQKHKRQWQREEMWDE